VTGPVSTSADTHRIVIDESGPVATQAVTVTPVASRGRSYLTSDPMEWSPEQLRDYVISEIEARFGVRGRDPIRETAIFKRFVKTWGELAGPIAKFAFEVRDGWWQNAPISINRFCRQSDSYFARPIAEQVIERLG
jgi:hypothetical protein